MNDRQLMQRAVAPAAGMRQSGANRLQTQNMENGGRGGHGDDTEVNTMYYMLKGTDSGKFSIGGNGGRIKVKAGDIPDPEAKTWRSVTVNVSGRKGSEDRADTEIGDGVEATINAANTNEPPGKPGASTRKAVILAGCRHPGCSGHGRPACHPGLLD